MPLAFKQEQQREAAAFLQQEEQSAFLGKGAIPKTRKAKAKKTKEKKTEDVLAGMFAEEIEIAKPSKPSKKPNVKKTSHKKTSHIEISSKVAKTPRKCDGLTGFDFKDFGCFLAGTVVVAGIFILIRQFALNDVCFTMPRMDEKVLNDFISEGVFKMVGRFNFMDSKGFNGHNLQYSFNFDDKTVSDFFNALIEFQKQLQDLTNRIKLIN